MYILIAIVQNEDISNLMNSLNTLGIGSTKISSTGGFLRSGNATLLVALEKSRIDEVIETIKHTCKKRKKHVSSFLSTDDYTAAHINNFVEVEIGGASIFVIKLDDFIKL